MPSLLLSLIFAGCGEPAAPEAPPAPAAAQDDPAEPAANAERPAGEPEIQILVDLPEMQKALTNAGIDVELSSLVQKRTYDLERADQDLAAVRTGVVLADALLTVKTAEKPVLVERMNTVRSGMKRLESGPTIDNTLAELIRVIQVEAASREELVASFRDLSIEIISELEFREREKVVPLIEAGAYLEGANLVARALQQVPDRSSGDDLLKRGTAVNYFIEFVSTEANDKLSRETRSMLIDVLTKLKAVADKEGKLSDDDLAMVVSSTEDVLGFL